MHRTRKTSLRNLHGHGRFGKKKVLGCLAVAAFTHTFALLSQASFLRLVGEAQGRSVGTTNSPRTATGIAQQSWQRHLPTVRHATPSSELQAPAEVPAFRFDVVALLAGFAFDTYNTPETARWERGEDGLNVALLSDDFVPSVYKGVLSVRLIAVEDLREETGGTVEWMTTGGRSDPYVLLNIIEDGQTLLSESIIASGSLNEARSKQSLDVKRSSTIWRGGGEGRAEWEGEGDGEVLRLYLKDPEQARLGIRVMDENIAVADELLGANEAVVQTLLSDGGSWAGKIPLRYKEKSLDLGAGLLGAAAAAVSGIMTGGASLAIGAAAVLFKAVSPADQAGSVEMQLEYQELESAAADERDSVKIPGRAPVGASEGVDWSRLSSAVGGMASAADQYDFLGFVSHEHTSTEAGIWRNVAERRIILAFRGTEMTDIKDLMTDVSIVKTPWASVEEGDPEPSDSEAWVHAGFRRALDSVAQRLKALLREAVAGAPEDWELLLTGHSLGGALATLMALDLGGGLDAARGLPRAPRPVPWFQQLFFGGDEQPAETSGPPKFKRLSLYTFGAPRVGNAGFASALDDAVPEAYRIVNSQDIVARFPRGFYQHGGRTVLLLNESSDELVSTATKLKASKGLWVEGMSEGKDPLRDDMVVRNPLDKESLLGGLVSTFEQGSMASLTNAANKASEAAVELQKRLGSAGGTAQQDFQQVIDAAQASVDEFRNASSRAAFFGEKLKAASRANASKEELQLLEDQAANAVAEDLQRALAKMQMLGKSSKLLSESGSSSDQIAKATGETVEEVTDAFSRTAQSLQQRVTSASFGDFASVVGIDAAYADSEVRLLKAITTGEAILMHLEPSYHEAMWSVARSNDAEDAESNPALGTPIQA